MTRRTVNDLVCRTEYKENELFVDDNDDKISKIVILSIWLLTKKGQQKEYCYHLVKCTTTPVPETHTGHCVCVSSCQEKWEHRGYCRKAGNHTVCKQQRTKLFSSKHK